MPLKLTCPRILVDNQRIMRKVMRKTGGNEKGDCQTILDGAIEGILIAEIESKAFKYANKAICEMFGYEEKEMLTLTVADIHPKDKLDEVINIFEAQARGEIALAQSTPCQRKNGTVFWADINTSKTFIDGVPCNVGFFSDVTEKIRSEKEIDASHRLLTSLFDAVPDLLIVIDKKFQIRYTNFKGHDLINQSDSDKGKTCYGRFKLLDSPCEDCSALPVFDSGAIVEREMVNPADGRTREVRAFPIKDFSGQVVYVVEYVRDITDKKQAEKDRIRLEQQIQQNQKLESLGVLAGGIAHDFNNLLGGIYGYIDMAREASENEEVLKYLDTTLNTMNRARSLTQQLLTFAKGGMPKREPGRLNQFVRDTVEFALSGSNVSCRYTIADDLWFCDYDKSQMAQVIDNIVINAQQAMPVGGTIELIAENRRIQKDEHLILPAGDYVQVSIKDTGIGIPHDIIQRIFDPFFTTKQKGSGLGLATSYSIVKKHDGYIDVESTPGEGAHFSIVLPASKFVEKAKKEYGKTCKRHSGRILIMDDEEVIRDTMTQMLIKSDVKVVTAREGNEALEVFMESIKSGKKFDIVILDLTVPGGMGGKATLDGIRKLDKQIPVIVSSGYAEDPIVQNPKRYGFNGSIKKPFIKSELVDMILKYL